jgi:Mg-chelatase subunit ChlD
LPGGVRHAGSSGPYVEESDLAAWRIEPFPSNGVTLTQRLRPIVPGAYSIGSELSFRLVDDRGRVAETRAAGPAELDKNLSVSASCAGQRRTTLYLPLVRQPRCTPLRQAADIVLAIDRSTSMGTAGAGAAEAASLLDMLNLRRDRLALLAFDQRVEPIAALGSDRDRLLSALVGLSPAAGTSIDRAIQAGSALLAGSTGRRRLLILVTDGVQTGPWGRGSVLSAAEVARRGGLAIMAIAVGPAPDIDLLESIATAGLVRASQLEELGPAYRSMGELAACTQ